MDRRWRGGRTLSIAPRLRGMTQRPVAVISSRGARRWQDGHPWIFKSDVVTPPAAAAGAVTVRDVQARTLGTALWSPQSEISLRFVARDEVTLDGAWWGARIGAAIARRQGILDGETNACRLVHGEGDGLPSLVVDRFDRWLVVQLLSAGLEAYRAEIVDALVTLTDAAGVLARNDASVRTREGLAKTVELLAGSVPETRTDAARHIAAASPATSRPSAASVGIMS